jgi:hypothetical protein
LNARQRAAEPIGARLAVCFAPLDCRAAAHQFEQSRFGAQPGNQLGLAC